VGRCEGCQRQAVLIRCNRIRSYRGEVTGHEVMACERCVNVWGSLGQLYGAPADARVLQGPLADGGLHGPEAQRAPRRTSVGLNYCPVCNGSQWLCHVCRTPTMVDGDHEVCPCCQDGAGRPLTQRPWEHGWT